MKFSILTGKYPDLKSRLSPTLLIGAVNHI